MRLSEWLAREAPVTVDGAVRSETECRTVAAESGGRGQTEMYESGERSQLLKAHKFTEDTPAPPGV